jgi:hypothetical protein
MIELGTNKTQFTKPINFVLNYQEKFNINNCDSDTITVRINQSDITSCRVLYIPKNRTPSENLIGNLV